MSNHFTIDAKVLAEALAIIGTAVEKKNTIPVLSYVLLEGVNGVIAITGTDLDATVKMTVDGKGEGAFCLPLDQLRELTAITNGSIAIKQTTKDRATLTADRCEASKVPLMEKDVFPLCPTVRGDGVKIAGPLLAAMLKVAALAAATHDYAKWGIQSVHLSLKGGNLTLAATDEKQLAVVTVPMDSADEAEFLIPRRSVRALIAFASINETVELAQSDNHFGLIGANGSVSTRLLAGTFPDWLKFMPEKFDHVVEIERDDLLLVLKRGLIAIDDNQGSRWTVGKKSLAVASHSTERGEGLGTLAIACPTLNGNDAVLGVNGPQVLKLVAAMSGSLQFSFIDDSKPFKFQGVADGFEYYYLSACMDVTRC